MNRSKKSFLLAVVSMLLTAAVVVTTIYAASGFTIKKVDEKGDPIKGVEFEVYGKPTLTVKEPEEQFTEVTVVKVWDDKENQDGLRPDKLEVTLSTGDKYELSEKNKWTVTVKDLPKNKDGKEIEYTWTEADVEGYTAEFKKKVQ